VVARLSRLLRHLTNVERGQPLAREYGPRGEGGCDNG
jgi:hypothetical protein